METIKARIGWTSNEYSDTPKMVKIELTDALKEKVKFCIELTKTHKLNSIVISVDAEMFDEGEGDFDPVTDEFTGEYVENTEWRCDTQELRISDYGVYFYAQNKWDSGDQIESQCIYELFVPTPTEA